MKLLSTIKYLGYLPSEKNQIQRLIYKCKNLRNNKKFYHKTKHLSFCNSTFEYIYPRQGVKSGYFMKKEHSEECGNLNNKNKNKNNIVTNDNKEATINNNEIQFIEKCENFMNNSSILYRIFFKEEFKKIYNENKYILEIDNILLSNIISKCHNKTDRFKKTSVFI